MESALGEMSHLPLWAQDPFKLLALVCSIEDGLPNAVKAIAKQALGGSLMRLECNRFDPVPPSPAKRDHQHTA